MKQNVMLTIASLLSILLLTLHITDDIVRGISKAEPSNIALAVLVVLLYGTLVLAERRSGFVIMLLLGLFAAGMPVIHMRGEHYGELASPPAASSSSGHSGRSAGSEASPSSSRRADCGVYDGASPGSPKESPRKQLDEPARQKENVGRSRPARRESRCTSNLYSALRVIENAWEHSRKV